MPAASMYRLSLFGKQYTYSVLDILFNSCAQDSTSIRSQIRNNFLWDYIEKEILIFYLLRLKRF